MAEIEHVLQSFTFHHADGNTDMVLEAYKYALEKHEGQKRRSGEPYIVHPMSVAKIAADMGLCEPSICAALLHDVIEDTDTTREEIKEKFGEDVALLVEGLTKLDNVHFVHKEERQAESFRKMLIATVDDIRILLIKLADRLHNMSTLSALPPEKQERIAQETRDIYTPIAGRLGLAWLKADLDDLSFKYLEPEEYNRLAKEVKMTRRERIVFINRVKNQLQRLLVERGFDADVSGRLKNLHSIHMKMQRKDLAFEKIHDAIAFRVLCESIEQCYAIFGIVHSKWIPVPGYIKDYIAMPKANHYQSLHTTVVGDGGERMEIQIRTKEMHQIAEYGIAAHWAYKEGQKNTEKDVYLWLREILENQSDLDDSREFFDSVKVDLLHEDVFVFTPAGEIKTLSNGATPLDFAYAIHTEVGNHCRGARVNGVMVPFDTELRSGDHIEIITANEQRPSLAWLDIAKTSRARNKIKAYLRTEQREQSLQVGKSLLEKALRRSGISYNKMLKSRALDSLAPRYKLSGANDVIAAIGYGKLDENSVAYDLMPDDAKETAKSHIKESAFEKLLRKVKWQDDGIIIDGVDNMLVHFAKCCNPLPGEPVIGYISRGRGIIVHRQGCQQAAYLEKDRQTKVLWSQNATNKRPVKLQIISGDRPGILATLSNTFMNKQINIASVHCDTSDPGGAVSTFTFPIDNVTKLNELIRTLKQTKGVYEVNRLQS
ncbi:MAG: bifunctional (p)ppGpp synthetase/guanosine-3',5'-bis(diphosphate) 3'-pyrophosphohydrolase [Deltaproteobacteria bacterium]|nr:bifunctional (p)ppGpp synthetase/guanosine-3',5'-bis(diphosphate) 3'-pyrophosphohydrolase [Deltaproteobacteria bacterium]MBN2670332.1 bifunctional (p)ppGpp synthetase/guanosine-3',5'-bis(diphosphate) 3'-pyrophosphohydrolase [Deltaproteobacteria bacterium]